MTEEEKSENQTGTIEVDNLTINSEKKYIEVSVNPRIYPLAVVMNATYNFMDKANTIVDGDLREEIIVKLWPLDSDVDLELMGKEFNTELVSESVLHKKSAESSVIRNALANTAFNVTNNDQCEDDEGCEENKDSDKGHISHRHAGDFDPDNMEGHDDNNL
jgi:His-Xaa-Ser system protein HxsD